MTGSSSPTVLSAGDAGRTFTRSVSNWAVTGLRDFVWRKGSFAPFQVLTTEVLLTRTKAETVARVLPDVLRRYPSPLRVARARRSSLERTIAPLGLQTKRSGHLIGMAHGLLDQHQGKVPASEEELLVLPGVGQYAADATLSVAFGIRRPIVDANVARLLRRCFGLPPAKERLASDILYRSVATSLLPDVRFLEYNWGLLDIATAFCKPSQPVCDTCPVADMCFTRRDSAPAGGGLAPDKGI